MAKKKASGDKKTLLTRRQGQQFKEWRKVAVAVAANLADLPGAVVQHAELVAVIEEVDKILAEQAVFQANKQITSRRLETLVNQGGKLTTVLKAITKQRYGHGNDKLVEFGIQPLRSRPKPTVVPPAAPPPVEAAGPPATSVPTSTTPSS
jgi:hypothetical protein